MKPKTCLVVDVWEGQLEIDEPVLKAAGVAGMGIRLNDMNGGHHMDTNFYAQWEQAVNFVRFPYFVFNPWVDGAANFAWLITHLPTEVLCFALDVEVKYSAVSPAKYAGEIVKFLDLCAKRGLRVIIYTGQWFLPYLSSWPKVDYWWAQYPDPYLYFSGVTTWAELKLRLDSDKLAKPFNSGAVPGILKMWQFSGDYLRLPGNSRAMDVNLFMGSVEDLQDYFGTGADPEPKPEIIPSNLYQFSTVNYYARPGGGPLTLPVSRVPGKADNMTNYDWPTLKPIIEKLNPENKADAVAKYSAKDWGPTKGTEVVGAGKNQRTIIKVIGMLGPGRNVVKVESNSGGYGTITGVPISEAGTLNAYDNPDKVHLMYDYNKTTGWGDRNKKVYIPILDGADAGPWYVDMSKLVSIDAQLPKIVKITAYPTLNVRAGAGKDFGKVGSLAYGVSVIIDQIAIGKGGIWGHTSAGWIGLRADGANWTDWKI